MTTVEESIRILLESFQHWVHNPSALSMINAEVLLVSCFSHTIRAMPAAFSEADGLADTDSSPRAAVCAHLGLWVRAGSS